MEVLLNAIFSGMAGILFYYWGFSRGVDKGIQDAIDTLNEIGFSDEQVQLMNERFFKEKK